MSFDLDQECRHAKERLRVSIEANTAYELKQMQKKYAATKEQTSNLKTIEEQFAYYCGLGNASQQNMQHGMFFNGQQFGNSAYGLGALGSWFGA